VPKLYKFQICLFTPL
jgi:hypothetical protein